MSRFTEELEYLFSQGGGGITPRQAEQMECYYEYLLETNQKYNITTVTEPKTAALKHFYDSAFPAAQLKQGASVVDVGSGGGFPAVPLKIMRPDIRVCAVEASQKKCGFITEACQRAGIELEVKNARAEDLARGCLREHFDVCVSRAVAALPVLLELCIPLVKKEGLFLAYKGNYEAEMKMAEHAAHSLGAALVCVTKMPAEGYAHYILAFQKHAKTAPAYPRNYAQICKRPL